MRDKIRKQLVGSTLALFVFAVGCGKPPSTPTASSVSEDKSEGSLEARIDKHGEKIMVSSAKAEARQWMKQPSHVIFKTDPKQVAKFVEEFYDAGATQVLIADIEEHEGKQFGGGLSHADDTTSCSRPWERTGCPCR
jgi:hypothetical protein